MRKVWRMLRFALIILVIVAAAPFLLRLALAVWFVPRTASADAVAEGRVAIVFGAQVYPSGQPSPMLADRVAAGADLYHTGKVTTLIMSGDGRAPEYNEPDAMKRYAMRLGVPEAAIITDYGGTRTYDTCYRAARVYRVERATLVTQRFHMDRALLLCSVLGVRAVGVPADYQRPGGYDTYALRWSQLREIPATVLAVWDLIEREPPASLAR